MAEAASKQRQGRSPAYPSVPLKTALEKAQDQYLREGKYPVPLTSAFKAWGYSPKSSRGREVRASMRYFGLITIEGDGDHAKIKLTDDALRVIMDKREDQTEKNAIVRRLALNPSSHKKLWNQFPDGIKSDATASHYLVFNEGYNESAAAALIAEFRETAGFAKLYEPASVEGIEEIVEAPDDLSGGDSAVENDDEGRKGPPPSTKRVSIMDGERVAFIEEGKPGQYLKLIAAGDVDDTLLEALEDYVKRQRKRLGIAIPPKASQPN